MTFPKNNQTSRNYPKSVAGGLGSRCGTRPLRLRVPKAELLDLVAELHGRGLGGYTISKMIGYSHAITSRYISDMGLGTHTYATTLSRIIDHLPADVKARVLRIKTKSDIAHERAWNRVNGTSGHVQTHELIDRDADTCVNRGGPVRPEKAAA